MTLRQHIPDYFEGAEPQEISGDTLDSLLQPDWVQRWARYPEFFRFSISKAGRGDQPLLMAELQHGKLWWVVGYLDGDPGGLPEWKPPEPR
jgi:hypothetical protein